MHMVQVTPAQELAPRRDVAIFDLDGTLTDCDPFLRYLIGNLCARLPDGGEASSSAGVLLYFTGRRDNNCLKILFLRHVLGRMTCQLGMLDESHDPKPRTSRGEPSVRRRMARSTAGAHRNASFAAEVQSNSEGRGAFVTSQLKRPSSRWRGSLPVQIAALRMTADTSARYWTTCRSPRRRRYLPETKLQQTPQENCGACRRGRAVGVCRPTKRRPRQRPGVCQSQ